jgi:predicted alpha-1,2-mannosidase
VRRAAVAAMAAAAMLSAASPAHAARDYAGLVNPWVESDRGRFFFFQSAGNPFGFVKLRPDASTGSGWDEGYPRDRNVVKGFSHLHDWRLSGIQVMPTSGPAVPKTQGDTAWQSPVQHDASEVARPGYHRLHLDRYDIDAELTATDRVGLHRYAFGKAGPAEIILNLGGTLGQATMKDAHIERVGHRRITGWVRQSSDGYPAHDTKLYFDARFDRPFDSLGGWAGGRTTASVDTVDGNDAGAFAHFDHLDAGDVVQMRVALSLTGTDGAARNMEAEAPGWDFDAAERASRRRWNEMLGRFDVSGGTHQQQVKFYTDLFHVLVGRGMVSDADGRYIDDTWNASRVRQVPLGADDRPKFAMFNYDALWLTQWNLNTVLGLAYPEVYSSFVHSQLQMYEDGGLLPRGPVAGNYSMVMTSSPATSFITGAWNKGIRDFDPDVAYDAMLDAHSVGGLFDKTAFEYDGWTGVGGIRSYLDRGYVPQELATGPLNGGAGQTLEYSFQDWALGNFTHEIGGRHGINAAQFAHASVSSQADAGNGAGARAIDGRPIRSGAVEWASTEEDPWIELRFDHARRIHEVVLSDRADPAVNANGGTLRFDDGSTVPVTGIPADGSRKVVEFSPRETESVRFEVAGGEGGGVGLNEIEAWDDTDVAGYLKQRSRNWRNLYDPSTGFVRPRRADGSWLTPFDPLSGQDFVEANAWQATWFTSHDVMGLANLMGGEETYASKLDFAFRSAEKSNFIADYGEGLVSYGNQPGLQMAHLFNYVGYPWLSQHWVREVKEKTYGATSASDGYGHFDEDFGQMGALSALMAIGLFEVSGGGLEHPVYDITSPIFKEVTIDLGRRYGRGKKFRVVTHGDLGDQYIQRAELDGERLDNAWFRHEQLADGGELDLWLGEEPNTRWGTKELPPSESASEHRKAVHAAAVRISGPDAVRVPYESVPFTASFEPSDTSLKQAYWTVTEPDGSPTDRATIDSTGTLKAGDRSGPVRVTATAADRGGATASKLVDLDLDPGLLRSNAARWPDVSLTASSEFSSGFPVSHVNDGFDRTSGDWASRGQQDPWVELRWKAPIRADRVVLYDRTSADDADGGVLQFSDGSTVPVSAIPKNGDPRTVTFPMREFDSLRFQVQGGNGPNVGLLEFEVYAAPKPPGPPARVSVERGAGEATVSWTPPEFDGGAPLTGYTVHTPHGDRAVGADERWLTVPAQPGDALSVSASNLIGSGPERGEPVYATRIDVTGLDRITEPDAEVAYRAELTPADTTYEDVAWSVTEPDGSPTSKAVIGADGVLTVNRESGDILVTATNADGGPEVHGTKRVTIDIDPATIRENAARWPGVTAAASSEFGLAFGAARVHDGLAAGSADWASAGEQDPWVELRWPEPVEADRIVLYDRTSRDDANAGTLTFGDGSTVDVTGIPASGDPKDVRFPIRAFDSVRFQVTGGSGPNVGLLELEVYARPQQTTTSTSTRQGK